MAKGDLQREVRERFGARLEALSFRETDYLFDDAHFSNEMLTLTNGKIILRIVRDRGDILVDIKDAAGWRYIGEDGFRKLLG